MPVVPNYVQTLAQIQPTAFAAGASSAYVLWQGLSAAAAAFQAQQQTISQSFSGWFANYSAAAAEDDRAARFTVTQVAIVGGNPSLTSSVSAAFGVAALGVPQALAIDSSSTTNAALVARVAAAKSLLNQTGATCVSSSETTAGILAWLTAADGAATNFWATKPSPDPTAAPAYQNALSALIAANAAALAFIGAGGFA